MPKDAINYSFTEPPAPASGGIVYDFYDVFVPGEIFRRPTLWSWGRNAYGQLGVNDGSGRSTPVTVASSQNNWRYVSGGGEFVAAIKTDGTLWTWGRNAQGQLGINNTTQANTPVTTFAGGNNWKIVACGRYYTIAIKTDGTLWTWGQNSYGVLGVNDVTQRNTPVTTFAGGTNWKQISATFSIFSGGTSTAVKTDGTLWVWGDNSYAQLGINSKVHKSTPVTTFAGGNNWKYVACARRATGAIKTDGTFWNWGDNSNGALGNNLNNSTQYSTPITTFAGGTNWQSAAGKDRGFLAIKTDGTLWAWGSDSGGINGVNSGVSDKLTPITTLAGGTNWKFISAGGKTATAIKTDATLWVWGDNSTAQLGLNDTTQRNTPVPSSLSGEWTYCSISNASNDWDSMYAIQTPYDV